MGLYSVTVYGFVNRDGYFSRHKIIEVDKKLKHLRRHSLKTIQSKDGDIIDCIDIKKQPAFDHPALKDHKIQMAPTPTYNSVKEDTTPTKSKPKTMKQRAEGSSMIVTSQVWQKSGTCPEGTIPVRRIRKRDLLKAHSIEEYGRKKPSFSHRKVDQLNQNLESFLQLQNHSKAILFTDGYRYLGGKGDLKVCNPFVERDDEYSTAQIALLNGAYNDFECIESGWAVNPSVYGDRQTRLFIYWTADASKKTGCFDLICPGFVQTSNEIALGAAIYPISIPGGLPYIINIYIYKDPITNNWWLQYGEKTNVGYWPPELFEAICYNAESVEWGGEVYSTRVAHSTPHTRTQMGNGHFATVYGDACSVSRMRIHDNSATLKIPEWVAKFSDEYYCYDVWYMGDYIEDPQLYYGGPGRNPMCP
ncbi:protein neprosin-like [Gastrolobium bilobum]|uniref:protein neprosin-like n=1 Tax=Gastrolobium bilobum TaxID=150636 RepID=UPI002AAF972E|nr:protein neprosin-like [Gastrolobium bilobum]